ncbi:hypothetical protein ACS0TY_033809 [Phlomoides rotata]
MDNSEKQQSANGRWIDDGDRADQSSGGEGSINVSSSGEETSASANRSVTRRLTEILVEDRDGDLLLQRNDRDDAVIQWLRALDMQVMGACRADERLKPLLKLNVSNGVAEDGLLAHLSQHFEPSEVGMLARCLCMPLVSIRVGKINKQGSLLSPTSVRGNLCLTLLPTSVLRISFNGDDGSVERLTTLSTEARRIDVEIEEISSDKSGRSFLIKKSDNVVSYFWCSEKSKLLGNELLRKMKDLLVRKPSLAELTGISESRLNCFATQLRAYLAGSVAPSSDSSESRFPQSSFNCSKTSRFRQCGSKTLSPRSSSFKEGPPKSLLNIRNAAAREKLRRRGENHIDSLSLAPSKSSNSSTCNSFQKDKNPQVNGTNPFPSFNFLELPLSVPEIQVPFSGSSPFSPHYCWCPPISSTQQYAKGNPQFPISSTESFSLPPLSSLLSSTRPSTVLTSKPPPVDFPSFLPDPLVGLPHSQQIPTFTPFICDPIVHIPVIDVCSSGQGYLVSAGGPAMSTSISPLNPNFVDPLLPNTESVVEKSARETLRMLISSSNQNKPQLLKVFPSVLSSSVDDKKIFGSNMGLYSGSGDVDAIPGSMSSMGLVFLSGKSIDSKIDLIDQKEKPSGSDLCNFDGGIN